MYDYIFRRVNFPEKVTAWTSWFELPLFKTKIAKSLLSESLLQNVADIERDPEPYKAYSDVFDRNGEKIVKPTEEKKQEKATEEPERSKRSADENAESVKISFSDHEAITSTIYIWA